MAVNSRRVFEDFWPHYLAAHSRPSTRWFHFAGTVVWLGLLAGALATGRWVLLAAIPFGAYGLAWFSHFFIERNKPATFKHPLLSLLADHKMAFLMVTGQLERELIRHNISPRPVAANPAEAD
ncbi:MAG: Mpo1-like protein [Candidatus Acidiferrales bacterium]